MNLKSLMIPKEYLTAVNGRAENKMAKIKTIQKNKQ
jgi:hypothetical protein